MPKYVKGQSGNPNGRRKGSLNKSTEEMKRFIATVISENLDLMSEDFQKMSPATRWSLLEKFGKYVIPTLSQQKVEGEVKGDIKIVVEWGDPEINDSDMNGTDKD